MSTRTTFVLSLLCFVCGCMSESSAPNKQPASEQQATAQRPTSGQQSSEVSPSPSPSPNAESAEPQKQLEPKEIYDAEMELLATGTGELAKLRKRGDLEGCGELMRPTLEKALEMNKQVNGLSMDYFNLKVAATHMTMCVVCNNDADFNCKEAKSLLKKAKEELAQKD